MARGEWGAALYRGEKSYDFVGHKRRWYAISGVILLISVLGLAFNGLNLGIEFKGGAVFDFPRNGHSISDARDAVRPLVSRDPIVTENSQGALRVQTEPLQTRPVDEVAEVQGAIAAKFGIARDQISPQTVGPTWGDQITRKAATSLIVFLVLVVAFLSIRFEPKMAIAAIIALIHDLVITIGVYAVLGFEVTPATVIGLLTILGYSLYDTVVVFDKVRENTQGITGGNRTTYSQAANLALNQTLVRSINTSVIALLPVGAILFIGSAVLGAGTLKDLSLALFVGLAAGTYSSIFIATPLLADLKEREPQMRTLARRVDARVAAGKAAGVGGTAAAAAPATARTATAVLDRDDDSDGDDDEISPDGQARAEAPARPAGRPGRPVSSGPRQQPRRKKSRGGRPRGRKRR